MNIKDLIAEVREHHRRATPGPWLHYKRAHPSPAWAVTDVEDENAQQITAEGEPNDIALIAHDRTAAPLLADEVERLDAENATLRSNLQSIEHALSDRRKPGETLEWTIAEMFADLDRAHQENATLRAQVDEAKTRADNAYAEGLADGQTAAERECDAEPEPDPEKVAAFKAEMERVCAQFQETRLTLLAEQGKPEGAVSDRWRVSYNLHGFEWWRGEDDELPEVECHLSGGEWRWTKPGFESNPYPTARACMLAADKDST